MSIYFEKYREFIFKLVCGVAMCYMCYIFFWILSRKDKSNSIKSLESRSLNGIIVSIHKQTHGYYRINVIDKIRGDSLCYRLYGDSFFNKQYGIIKVGDSISKDTNSRIVKFHSYKEKGLYKRDTTYTLPLFNEYKLDRIKELETRRLNGIIVSIEAKTSGYYYIGVVDKITRDSLRYNLHGRTLFSDEYNIKIGDSISKDINSSKVIFYSYKGKGNYEKECVYELPQY